MKKTLLTLMLLMVFTGAALPQAPFSEFKFGILDPKDVNKSGYIYGVNLGRMIDESISWSFELNYFQKGYRKVTTVDKVTLPSGITVENKALELEYKTRILPLFAKLNYEHPIGYRSPFYMRAAVGLGWEMVWNEERIYLDNSQKTRFFHGFGWQGSGGIGVEISSSANFFIDAFYNGSTVKRNSSKSANGLQTWEE
ncbi:MAG: hypothetical protein WAN36_02005, partial [Calditrichia bacterium]